MSEETDGADVDLSLAGQRLNIKNVKSLNTLATIATLILLSAGLAGGYLMLSAHAAETKDASKELVSALKEMTQAAREQNCLISMPIEQRARDPELCRRLAR